ncbi:hypothetical protein RB195_013364 [Necator americanus]|uniref:Uncharacterized protein n=1 Tax=Necator americanus TaxID=51031 RepID=A0ABR1DV59_NECAM
MFILLPLEEAEASVAQSVRGSSVNARSMVRNRPSANQATHPSEVDKLVPDFSGRLKTPTRRIGEPSQIPVTLFGCS